MRLTGATRWIVRPRSDCGSREPVRPRRSCATRGHMGCASSPDAPQSSGYRADGGERPDGSEAENPVARHGGRRLASVIRPRGARRGDPRAVCVAIIHPARPPIAHSKDGVLRSWLDAGRAEPDAIGIGLRR